MSLYRSTLRAAASIHPSLQAKLRSNIRDIFDAYRTEYDLKKIRTLIDNGKMHVETLRMLGGLDAETKAMLFTPQAFVDKYQREALLRQQQDSGSGQG